MKKYRVFCETDNKFENVISDATPTSCPVNGTHIINAEITSILDENVLVNDGTPKQLSLNNYKQLRYNEIDAKSVSLIKSFVFDGKTFSLSLPSQINWNTIKDNINDFTFPLDITTIDNDTYSLTQVNVVPFWTAARDEVKIHLDSGRAIKKQIFDASDELTIDGILDNR